MSVKNKRVPQSYDQYSLGYDRTDLVFKRTAKNEFGFIITKEGEYIPANALATNQYNPQNIYPENGTYTNYPNTAYSEDWNQPRNPNMRQGPDIPRPTPSMRDDDPRMQYTNRTKPKPY